MAVAFSLLYWAFFALSCVPLFAGALLIWLVTAPFDRNRRVLHLYTCFWAQLYVYVNPLWRLQVTGRDLLPWRGPAVIVANHASLGDILLLFGLYRPFKWVSKRSVFSAPFLGWNMWLNGYVPLVRGDKDSIARMMAASARWLDRGVPMLLFPEGTRSKDAQVAAFKDGAFRLAVEKGCPVIPVAIVGSGNVLPKHGWVLRERSRRMFVQVLPQLLPGDFGNDPARLRDEARARIIAAKTALETQQP